MIAGNNKKKSDKNLFIGILSLIINAVLFVIKFWAGKISGSVALIADAWHTLSDSLTSIVFIISYKLSRKPADKDHPYGHGRIELIGSLIIGVLLAIVGFNFLVESINNFFDKEEAVFGREAIIAMIISIVLKELIARISIIRGKKQNLKSLIADGYHHRSDALSSLIILAGIFLNDYFWWIDSLMGFLVSLFIFYTAYEIIKSSVNPLIGENADKKLISEIKQISEEECKRNLNIHDIKTHNYVYQKEIIFHIVLPSEMNLKDAHDIAHRIEKSIMEKTGYNATIHMDPEGGLID